MRHKLTLPQHPNSLFLIIIFDLFALVAVYGLYATNWVGQTGQNLTLPTAITKPYKISKNYQTLTLFSDNHPNCLIGRKEIPLSGLKAELLRQQQTTGIEEILLLVDATASIKTERTAINHIQELGLKCTLIAEPKPDF